ncbi:MAG: MmcQ/YjbR family DNA-binding protein [Clostridia bacterium]|nr:MmcQ/YjbR family DNA-binding protein [Clostridia bacterium]
MDINIIRKHLRSEKGATEDFKVEWEWERFMVGGKMFAAICRPSEKYAIEYAGFTLLSLKCDPTEAGFLRDKYPDILPGFYMDKNNWISVRTDGEVPSKLILELCDNSYRLVFSKLTKKLQREILQAIE